MQTGQASAGPSGFDSVRPPVAVLVRDTQSCIPLSRILSDGDLLYVFTPAVVPVEPANPTSQPEDPFEAFGRALAKYHPWIRHVPYLARNGITDYHVTHINFAKVIIFVISGPSRVGQHSQVSLSEVARSAGGLRPQIILACCSPRELGPIEDTIPTIIEISGYSRSQLESAADLLFGANVSTIARRPSSQSTALTSQRWLVDEWDVQGDLPTIHELWCQCLPDRFRLSRPALQRLLHRDGYAQHFVVREPTTREVLGFCATYTTFMDNSDACLGSLAAIVVKPSSRRRGVGLSLHNHALRQLPAHRRVSRLQLGSTFPRLLYGLPMELTSEDWFRRRGWRIDEDAPGSGQEACDWLLKLEDWHGDGLSSSGLSFRPCELDEYHLVTEFVARESVRKDSMGWFDQYQRLAGTQYVRDIIIGLEGGSIVATALTYTPNGGSQVAEDLPWPGTISNEVGGVTCICITGL